MSINRSFVFLLACLLWGALLRSQSVEPVNTAPPSTLSLFDFFLGQKDSLPLLQLETDWNLLIRRKMKEEYQPAVLSYRQEDGSMAELKVRIRARGNIRKEVCYYPPIKIKAKKRQLAALGFNPNNKLKLVLPCKNGNSYAECVAREALAYRLYELIHPIHVKTKLIRLAGFEKEEEKYAFLAFLVEEEEALAARLDATVVDRGIIRSSALERDSYLKMCFFQYMISNVDWSIANKHNVEILALPGFERMIAIPYDFDYAGFAGTPYAVPASSLPIKSVNQRYFLGYNVTEEEALRTAKFFLSKKDEILQTCAASELIKDKNAASLQRYLMKFFDLLEDDKKVIRNFANAD